MRLLSRRAAALIAIGGVAALAPVGAGLNMLSIRVPSFFANPQQSLPIRLGPAN